MDMTNDSLLSIGELADRTGVSRRTVRFYVQRGLIAPPVGRGRGSGYTAQHLEQIARVLRLQREGLPLETIAQLPAGSELAVAAAPPTALNEQTTQNPEDIKTQRTEERLSPPTRTVVNPSVVLRVPLGPGIRLEIDGDLRLPSPAVLDQLAAACREILARGETSGG
ncbi:MAG TPA: MerR family transcriptional regulator [Vicinamibacterales bacterium]|nr:MerR family transcriptional regulator [Vicinamibacterales bacterium]